MANADLRPMTLGEVLDRTFTLYKGHFWLFAGIMSLPFLLLFFFQVLIAAIGAAGRAVGQAPSVSPNVLIGAFGGAVVIVVLSFIMTGVAQAATIFAVSDLYLGRTATVRGAFGKVRGKVLRTIGVIFLAGLIVGLGFIALIIPGIILMCRTAVAVPAAMLEDKYAGEALSRSMALTKGYAMQMFLIFLLTWVLAVVAMVVFQYPFMLLTAMETAKQHAVPFAYLMLQQLATFISSVLVGPIATIAFSLMYYNLRVRKEAFDLQHLIASLPAGSQAITPVPGAPSAA
jgi:uncharacterized membrane protein